MLFAGWGDTEAWDGANNEVGFDNAFLVTAVKYDNNSFRKSSLVRKKPLSYNGNVPLVVRAGVERTKVRR